MKAQIKYTELEEIISSKTGQDITFRHSAAEGMDRDSINVGYVFTKTLPIIGQVRKELMKRPMKMKKIGAIVLYLIISL